jgi:hypothetical protein
MNHKISSVKEGRIQPATRIGQRKGDFSDKPRTEPRVIEQRPKMPYSPVFDDSSDIVQHKGTPETARIRNNAREEQNERV